MAYIETTSESRTVVYTDDKYQVEHVTDRVAQMDDPTDDQLEGRMIDFSLPDCWHVSIAPSVEGWDGHSIGSFDSFERAMAEISKECAVAARIVS